MCCARVGLDCGYFARKISSHKWCFALAVPHKGVENLLRSRACATMLSRLDVRVWCSEVTQNQPWLLCVQHLVGTWQDNLALRWSLRTVRLDLFAGSVLAAHGAREMNAEARSLAHAVFFTVEGHVGSETSNGRLVGTVGCNDDQHRERGPGWAHCLGKRRFGHAFRRHQNLERKCSTCLREECDCRLASGFLLCVSWYSLGARSFLRLPEAEPNDPSLHLSPWSSLGPVLLHAQLPPDPVGPAPVPRRVCRACSSAASQHRQGRVVPMLKLVGHGSKLRCVQTRTWSLARQRRSYHVSRIGICMWTRRRRRRTSYSVKMSTFAWVSRDSAPHHLLRVVLHDHLMSRLRLLLVRRRSIYSWLLHEKQCLRLGLGRQTIHGGLSAMSELWATN